MLQKISNFFNFFTFFLVFTLFVGLFASCSPKLALKINSNSDIDVLGESILKPSSETIIKRFSQLSDNYADSIFDLSELYSGFRSSGFTALRFDTPSFSKINLSAKLANFENLPESFLEVTSNSIKLEVNQNNISEIVNILGDESIFYLDLFMPPLLTGESLTQTEYIDLISAAYGKTIASELSSSVFLLTIECPSKITDYDIPNEASINLDDKIAKIILPMDYILTINSACTIFISW